MADRTGIRLSENSKRPTYVGKRPPKVLAIQVERAMELARGSWADLPAFLDAAYSRGEVIFASGAVMITRDTSRVTASPLDWLVLNAAGHVDVISHHLFEELFT